MNEALPKDRQRTVTLSRYAKVLRVVPDAEVAEGIAKQLDGLDIAVPFNVVTPSLREELIKRGVKIGEPEKGNAGKASRAAYDEWKGDEVRFSKDIEKDAHPTLLQTSNDVQAVQRDKHLSGTKVEINSENKEEISKNLSSLAEKVSTSQLPAEEFLAELRKSMKTESEDHSGYNTQIVDGEQLTLRISDHHANAKYAKQNREFKVVSVVIKTSYSKNRFRPHKEVELVEYTFDADKLTHDNEKSIVAGIHQWLETGRCDIKGAIKIRRSPREDAAYMDAVEKGDSKSVVSMLRKAAKAAMPNTKAVDKRGIPIVFYHGTRSYVTKPFTVFKPEEYGVFTSKDKDTAGWFADNYHVTPLGEVKNPFTMDDNSTYEDVLRFYKDMFDEQNAKVVRYGDNYGLEINGSYTPLGRTEAEVKKGLIDEIDDAIRNADLEKKNQWLGTNSRPLYRVFLNMENPLVVDAKGADYAYIEYEGKEWTAEELGKYAKENGYDGLIIKNNKETTSSGSRGNSDTYMVFSPNQIKSADPVTYDNDGKVIPLSERFNKKKDDIRFRLSEESEEKRREYAERQWARAHNLAHNTIKKLGISDNVTVVEQRQLAIT